MIFKTCRPADEDFYIKDWHKGWVRSFVQI